MTARRWVPFLAGIFLLGVLLDVPLLSGFTAMVAVVLGAASWWRDHALDGVIYRRRPYYRRAFPGEQVPLRIEVENRKWLPLSWLRVQDPWPRAVGPEDEGSLAPSHLVDEGLLVNVFSLRWFERARRRFTLRFHKRGVYRVGPARLESGDLFGFFEQTREVGSPDYLTVFPALMPFSSLQLAADDPFGERRARRRIFEDPNLPMGVREYHPEDEFRRVHWPATAHTGELQAKTYQPVTARVFVVCLNAATFVRHWEGTLSALLEHLISVAATLVHRGIEAGYQVGLISNGCLANSDQPFRIQPGRSPRQLTHLLEALAGVNPVITAPFDRFLLREAARVPYGASLFVVTANTPPELMESLVRLKRRGRRITLISFAQEPPEPIAGVGVIHRPFEGDARA